MEIEVWAIFRALLLLSVANGAPVIAKKIFGTRLAFPLDAGAPFLDGGPVFGQSKTIRGLLVSVAATSAAASLLGLSVGQGALVAAFAMIGDLVSSFIKRRLRLLPSAQAIGLDQIPESVLPLAVCRRMLSLSWVDVAIATGIFIVGELVVSRLLYAMHVRDEPY
ncbi:MAG: CDP-archaeol synthase [Bradyrhizobium sp.]|uniref:CDP-archaeol synthase n=1 Tax=Bradyrhizobium sp. TaxID=376 RepID=UPI0025BFAF04|nr:CDP-archaeol synthase [Bradyrhizobium sp.]MBI5265083.1 CDP-archaeol synthase [Bradyrhizobium sp.]